MCCIAVFSLFKFQPFESPFGYADVHPGIFFSEICRNKEGVVVVVTKEYEMPVLVETFRVIVAVAEVVSHSLGDGIVCGGEFEQGRVLYKEPKFLFIESGLQHKCFKLYC